MNRRKFFTAAAGAAVGAPLAVLASDAGDASPNVSREDLTDAVRDIRAMEVEVGERLYSYFDCG